MRVLVSGFGAIGQRHVRNLRALVPDCHITLLRHRSADDRAYSGIDTVVSSVDQALEQTVNGAILAGPSSTHLAEAMAFARAGVPLLIEKPLSNTLLGVEAFEALCAEQAVPVLVGYNFRFAPPLRAMRQALLDGVIGEPLHCRAEVGQHLSQWRPGTDYHESVSARKDLGGGAILELSHELDYICWLMGEVESLAARSGNLGELNIEVEDFAEILLQFRSGAVGSVHMDMYQVVPKRYVHITGDRGRLELDFLSGRLLCSTPATPEGTTLRAKWCEDRNEMYLRELKHFIECTKGKADPYIPLAEGVRALRIAEAVAIAANTKTWVTV